jgi:ribonuclease BN (tRNA processing enzyme)
VEVRFVGSGDAFGSGGRFQTCIRLRTDDATVLVDCGATSLTALKAQGLDPGEVEVVVLSHLHGDHFGGLPFLILDGQFTRRTRPLTVFGPTGTRDRLHTAMEALYPGSAGVWRRFDVEVVELDGAGGAHRHGGWTVRSWEVDHASGAPALAVRVDADGTSFGYSGDTAWTPALCRAADGVDLFACEAYTWDKAVPFHLAYRTLCEHVDELRLGRLVLTHMGPSMLARQAEAQHQTATDGLVLQVGMSSRRG